jgi:hypothetical protein
LGEASGVTDEEKREEGGRRRGEDRALDMNYSAGIFLTTEAMRKRLVF